MEICAPRIKLTGVELCSMFNFFRGLLWQMLNVYRCQFFQNYGIFAVRNSRRPGI